MRIIAGEARGRRLAAPPGTRVRPTSDRVREAVFNSLYSLGDPIPGAAVLDLFAGSGALGLEALSRGAAGARFVEADAAARRALDANIDSLGFRDRAEVVAADALDWLGRDAEPADVAFADPPYAFDRWDDVLAVPLARIVVIESDRPVAIPTDRWGLAKEHRYGATVVQIIRSSFDPLE